MPTVLLLAGEPSGDAHGAKVARALSGRIPGIRLVGLGGERMEEAGVELLAGLEELAVMGFLEVLPRIPFFWRLERRLRAMLESGEVDLLLPIDYPGFNLRMTRHADRLGVPVLYYIAPQVWAWKEGRAARLAEHADHVAVILPFEEAIYRELGGEASFVGHPLVERPEDVPDRGTFCAREGLDPERPLLALMPGSRSQELDRHLDLFVETARRLVAEHPGLQPVLALAPSVDRGRLEVHGLRVVSETRALLRHARAALVKSGTGTLETALEATPFVTVYRTHPITFFLARRLVRVDHVALANLVAGERVVPEVLQGEATPERLAALLTPLLDTSSAERKRMVDALGTIRERLGDPGAAGRVADLAVRILDVDDGGGAGSAREGKGVGSGEGSRPAGEAESVGEARDRSTRTDVEEEGG